MAVQKRIRNLAGLVVVGASAALLALLAQYPHQKAQSIQLGQAIALRDTRTVRRLLEQGVNPNVRFDSRFITDALYSGKPSRPEPVSCLAPSVFWGSLQENLFVDHDLTTPLCTATLFSDVESTRLLLHHGAAPNQIVGLHRTALTCVWRDVDKESDRQIKTLLIQAGADPTIRDVYGRTALMEESRPEHASCLAILRQASSLDKPRGADK